MQTAAWAGCGGLLFCVNNCSKQLQQVSLSVCTTVLIMPSSTISALLSCLQVHKQERWLLQHVPRRRHPKRRPQSIQPKAQQLPQAQAQMGMMGMTQAAVASSAWYGLPRCCQHVHAQPTPRFQPTAQLAPAHSTMSAASIAVGRPVQGPQSPGAL
jgi:hypothetical protein